jgi:hypothetical protein
MIDLSQIMVIGRKPEYRNDRMLKEVGQLSSEFDDRDRLVKREDRPAKQPYLLASDYTESISVLYQVDIAKRFLMCPELPILCSKYATKLRPAKISSQKLICCSIVPVRVAEVTTKPSDKRAWIVYEILKQLAR